LVGLFLSLKLLSTLEYILWTSLPPH
jgi:hypothetical protein